MAKHKVPEMEFTYEVGRNGDRMHFAFIKYGKKEMGVLLYPESLRKSRESIIDVCMDMKIPGEYVAVYMERIYRWWLDQGGEKVR